MKSRCALPGLMLATLIFCPLTDAADPTTSTSVAPISSAQLQKIRAVLAQEGEVVMLAKFVSDFLGVTRDLDTVIAPAMTNRDEQSVIHQLQLLPDDRGALLSEVVGDITYFYWIDPNYVLLAAGQKHSHDPSTPMSRADAAPCVSRELSYWIEYANTH